MSLRDDPQAGEGITIRHLRTHDEMEACVELQRLTWGADFREVVSAAILNVSQRIGGVAAGAFAADGTLLGFVFGMTGVERGDIVHWSDMLAVRPEAQRLGLGRQLKEFQRDAVAALGATRMYWTYDPLVARNAQLNLNRLGARAWEYVPDMYGENTGSTLHAGLPTDRFIVMWPIGPTAEAPAPPVDAREAPVLNPDGVDPSAIDLDGAGTALRVEIPVDIGRVQAESIARAVSWRRSTRHAFQSALARGYVVSSFTLDTAAGRAYYLLTRLTRDFDARDGAARRPDRAS